VALWLVRVQKWSHTKAARAVGLHQSTVSNLCKEQGIPCRYAPFGARTRGPKAPQRRPGRRANAHRPKQRTAEYARRCQRAVALLHAGKPPAVVAARFHVTQRTLRRWRVQYPVTTRTRRRQSL
jgi:hypothetical protein